MSDEVLRPYQLQGVEYALGSRRCFVALPMRTGKSPVALEAIKKLEAYPAVIVCPAYTKAMWRALIEEWAPGVSFQIVRDLESSKVFESLTRGLGARIYVVNYEAIVAKDAKGTEKERKKTLSPLGEWFRDLKPKAVILDESQKIKNKKTKQSKACKAIAKHAFLRLCLTGTPIDARPEEFVSQLVFLDRIKEFGGEWMFKKRYCVSAHLPNCPGWMMCYCGQTKWGYWDFSGASNLQELNERLRASCYFRKTISECEIDLPPFRRELVPMVADLTEYRKAEGDFIRWMMENRGRDAAERAYRAEAITRMNVLKQLVAWAKLDAAIEWMREFTEQGGGYGHKLVAFTTHTNVQVEVVKSGLAVLGYLHLVINGTVPTESRQEIVTQFSEAPESCVLVANIHAAGLGLDLSAAKGCVFLELDWSPSIHDQAEARLMSHRRSEPVVASYLLVPGTIEEEIYKTLERKRRVIAQAVDGGLAYGDLLDVEMEIARGLAERKET